MRTLVEYVIRIVTGETTPPERDARLMANLPAVMESVEEDVTDLLPDGYVAEVIELREYGKRV